MKRVDEEFCKVQFDTFVKKFFTLPEVTWEEVAQRDEPPDYYLSLGNTRFAVEVTTLVEVISVGASPLLPHFQIHRLVVMQGARQASCSQRSSRPPCAERG